MSGYFRLSLVKAGYVR